MKMSKKSFWATKSVPKRISIIQSKSKNQELKFIRDPDKSYVYVKYKGKDIGFFCWDYQKKRWRFDRWHLEKKKR